MKKKKNQLPSGNVRIQIFDYKDPSGKKHYRSFTAPTKTEAKALANEWKMYRRQIKERVTVNNAVEQYINMKSGVLSPSTIRGYRQIQRYYLGPGTDMGEQDLRTIDNITIQFWVSRLSATLSPKTVRNVFGLFSAVLAVFLPDYQLRITLPAKTKPELYTPSDDDISALLAACTDPELEISILLAAFGPLRRSEICALEDTDIHGNTITVSKARVKDEDYFWITKHTPKTYGSNRTIEMPDFVIRKMEHIEGRIVKTEPDNISRKFQHLEEKVNLPGHIRFHDLRHYAASIMHAQGVPDQYIMKRGGWSSPYVMKSVYQGVISPEEERQTKKMMEHFSDVSLNVSHAVSHEVPNRPSL